MKVHVEIKCLMLYIKVMGGNVFGLAGNNIVLR